MRLAVFCLFILFNSLAHATVTEVTARVDKNPVMADESFTLEVIANGDVSRNAFDSSALLADFVVGRTSVSSQTQIINFKTSRATTWSTVLIPRKTGRFKIPSFTVDGVNSQPIDLMVVPVSQSASTPMRDIYITTEVDNAEVYLQQQIRYTVKLHLAQDLQRGSLAAPSMQGADVRQLGEDKEYSEIVKGKRYRIIERNFAVIPQKSGVFSIDAPLFEGEIIDNNRQSFAFFNRTKTVRRVGPSLEVNVLPIPANVNGHWLPSGYVQLTEEWQPADNKFKVGEPITRTLTLTAVGLVEEQLPEINSQYPDSLKTYPDQATTATVDRDNNLIAQRVESIAIIPNAMGEIVIPEVSVPWYNVLTKKMEYASLPAKVIQVAAASQTGNAIPANTALPQQQLPNSQTTSEAGELLPLATNGNATIWWSQSSWILLVLWLLTILAWGFQNRKRNSETTVPPEQLTQTDLNALKKALKAGDSSLIDKNLMAYLNQVCNTANQSVAACLAQLDDAGLNQAMDGFYASRFAPQKVSWQAEHMLNALTRIQKAKPDKAHGTALKTLYPA